MSDTFLHLEITSRQMWLVSKIEAKFGTFRPPLNIGELWAKCMSEFYESGLGPNLWYTFDGCLSVFWKNIAWVSKKDRGKTYCDYRRERGGLKTKKTCKPNTSFSCASPKPWQKEVGKFLPVSCIFSKHTTILRPFDRYFVNACMFFWECTRVKRRDW